MNTEPKQPISLADLDHAPSSLEGESDSVSRETYNQLKEGFVASEREKFALEEDNQRLKIKDNTAEVLNQLIKPMADKAFWFMCCYCIVVGIILFLSGFSEAKVGTNETHVKMPLFELDDSVLQFLVGSTAVTVIGLVGMVLTGVFVGARKN